MSDPRGVTASDAHGRDGYGGSRYGEQAGDESRHATTHKTTYGAPASGESGRSSRSSRSETGHGGDYGGRSADRGGGEAGYGGNSYSPPTTYGTPTTYGAPGGSGGDGGSSRATTYGAPAPSRSQRRAQSPRPSASSTSSGSRTGTRRARLVLKHLDPWSVLKLSIVLSVALFVVWMVAVGILYGVLSGMGVFDQVNGLYHDVTANPDDIIGPGKVLGIAALIGVVNTVLFTALATVGAFVYNMCSDLVGGVEVTLGERD